jgi:hypothetical protein
VRVEPFEFTSNGGRGNAFSRRVKSPKRTFYEVIMDFEKRFRQNQEMVFREEDDGAFLFDPDTGDLRYLNQSGKETFLMLGEDHDVNKVIHGMTELYPDVEAARIEADVKDFVKDLEENHFIPPVDRE